MPVVTSSRSRGSWPSRSASNGVRSRIATTTSYGSRALTSASVREMCSANTSIWPSERTADQSALARETCWIIIEDRDPHEADTTAPAAASARLITSPRRRPN